MKSASGGNQDKDDPLGLIQGQRNVSVTIEVRTNRLPENDRSSTVQIPSGRIRATGARLVEPSIVTHEHVGAATLGALRFGGDIQNFWF